jgi:diguanylate cyclase (GGDEF)-like protein
VKPGRAITAALRRGPGALPPSGRLGAAGSESEALLRVAAAAAGTHELNEVLEVAAEEALAALGAASLSVRRWELDGTTLQPVINVGDLGPGEQRYPGPAGSGPGPKPGADRLLQGGVAYFNSVDGPDVAAWAAARLRRLGKESEVGVPILVEGEPWGEVYATTAPGRPRFRSEDVRFLEAVAGQLALAVGRAELFSRVSRLAYEDPLTGLANRRALEERLQRAMLRAGGREGSLAVLLCDVDDLKAINDDLGHDAGDRALRRVAEALVAGAAAQPGSLVGRLAGDEFCVVMEGAGLDAARSLASAALATLARADDERILISCGAAALGAGATTPAQLLRAADAALYRAKSNGGGQILTAGSRAAERPPRGQRRALRRSTRERLREAVQELTERLEGDLAREGPLARIEAVGAALAEALNADAWAVSFAPAGSGVLRTVSLADGRDRRLEGLRIEVDNDVYPVESLPATARLIAAGTGAFVVYSDDPQADAAEREVLRRLDRAAVLAAAAADHDGTWLLEVYADARSAPLEEGRLEATLLARAAIPPQAAGTGGAALLERRTRQLQLTSALAARLAASSHPTEMILAVAEEVHAVLRVDACGVMRLRSHAPNAGAGEAVLEMAAGVGIFGQPAFLGFTQPADRGLIGRCVREGRPVLAPDVSAEPDYHSTHATRAVRSELDVPVRVGGRAWGAITVQALGPAAFDEEDGRLLASVADQLAAALRAASLYDQLERAYLGTAEALSAALDAKDSYTAEHSNSIVQRAEAVARRLGMEEGAVRVLRYAAAFHDIGKLAVPEAILNKAGPLSTDEREVVERHTVVGEQILSPVEFLSDVLPLVRSAHERFDGSGYPDGLAGDEIPLGARIVFACDTYDAMTTDRPYRAALPHEHAKAELRRVAGTQLDPAVVQALIEVLDS